MQTTIDRTTIDPRPRERLRAHVGAAAILAAALTALAASAGPLPGPPASPRSWPDWWATTDPALALGATLRLLATVLCAHLAVVTVVDLLGHLLGLRLLRRLAHRLAPAAWRTVVLRPLAVGTLAVPTVLSPVLTTAPAAAATTTATPTTPADDPAAPIVLELTMIEPAEPEASADPAAPSAPATPAEPAPTLEITPLGEPTAVSAEPVLILDVVPTDPVPDEQAPDTVDPTSPASPPPSVPPGATTAPPTSTDSTTPSPGPTAAATPPAASATETDHEDVVGSPTATSTDRHVVRPGESFWSIALDRTAAELGRAPSAREVHGPWRALIAANVERLPDPDNPDLLHPGLELTVPSTVQRR